MDQIFIISGLFYIETVSRTYTPGLYKPTLHLASDMYDFSWITFWKHLTIGHLVVILYINRSVLDSNISCCNSYCEILLVI